MGRFGQLLSTGSVSHYDLMLAVIPSVFLIAVLVGNLLSLPASVAVAGGSLVTSLALVDALFVNPPVPEQ